MSKQELSSLERSSIRKEFPDRTLHEVKNEYAFAALKKDGSVVTWGGHTCETNQICQELRDGVVQVFSASRAYAALKEDGSVTAWGTFGSGGSPSDEEK